MSQISDITFGWVCQLAGVKNAAGIRAFGVHLQKLRYVRGWTVTEPARSADVARMTIYRIESAELAASLDILLSLAHALEILPRELMDFAPSA